MPYALLVEDIARTSPDNRQTLESDGWIVDVVSDASAALGAMAEHLPDVVVIDLALPHMGGMQLLQDMLLDPDLRHVPRVVLSGGSSPVERRFVLGLGAAAWLSAPLTPARLLTAAWDHLSDATTSDTRPATFGT